MSGPASIKTPSDQLLARSFLYQFLAFLFRHPAASENGFSFKQNIPCWKEAMDAVQIPDKRRLGHSFKRLLRTLSRTPQAEQVRQFEACFGHTAQGAVPSYELEYGEEHTHRQPQQLGDIAAFYNAFGLKINGKIRERFDHISVECEFLHFLLYKEAYALKYDSEEKGAICREGSRRFLSEHLGRWLPSLSMRLSRYASQGLMKEIADFAVAFVTQDCQMAGISPGPENLPVRMVQENIDTGCMSCEKSRCPI